jgi:hypothetical protein
MIKNLVIRWGWMMLLVVAVQVVVVLGCASSAPRQPAQPVAYSYVVDAAGLSQRDLFARVNLWFVDVFKRAGAVIDYSDAESGVMMGKYENTLKMGAESYIVTSTVSVEVKDGKYRISFTNPMYRYAGRQMGAGSLAATALVPGAGLVVAGRRMSEPNRLQNDKGPVYREDMIKLVYAEWVSKAQSLQDRVFATGANW